MSLKEKVRRLVDLLDEEEEDLDAALEYLRWLASDERESLTEEEWAEVRAAEQRMARGKSVSLEELKRNLGL